MAMDIAIIDDHPLFATGLAAYLADLGNVRCFGSAAPALDALQRNHADLVLLDFYVPGGHAVDTIAALGRDCGAPRVVVISASLSPADRQASERAGAIAFVPKHSAPSVLLEICRTAMDNLLPAASDAAMSPVISRIAGRLGITERQLDVLVLMGHGYANREIADLLSIGPETVKSHAKALFDRLGASNRTQAIAIARENGLL